MNIILLKAIIILALIISAPNLNAATYYVRADGYASKENAVGPSSDSARCMNSSIFNNQQYSPGDIIYFSSLGGSFKTETIQSGIRSIVHIPSSGSKEYPIIYSGIDGERPLIDASDSVSSSGGINVFNKDNIEVRNFDIKGSGGFAAFNAASRSGESGYGVLVDNVNVLSAYGASNGNNDCFSMSDYAQVKFTSISATKCRPELLPYTGSHQAITGHGDSRYTVDGAVFSDSNYIVTNTLNTVAYLNNITASQFYVIGFAFGLNATNIASTVIDNSRLYIDSGSVLFENSPQVLKSTHLEFRNSEIVSTDSRTGYFYANIYLKNNHITIDDDGWNYIGMGGDLYLENNIIKISRIGQSFITGESLNSGDFYIRNNIFELDGLVSDSLIVYKNTVSSGKVHHNIFRNSNGINNIFIFENHAISPVIHNNLFFNSTLGGGIARLNHDGADGKNYYLKLNNNIFYNTEKIIDSDVILPVEATNNSYYGGDVLIGLNSITSDPGLLMTGNEYELQSWSPLIDNGVEVDVLYDLRGNPIQRQIDIGPIEYQLSTRDPENDDVRNNETGGGMLNIMFMIVYVFAKMLCTVKISRGSRSGVN